MSDIFQLLKENNFRFKKSLGQNFISDGNLLASIVSDAEIIKDDVVLEIGAGAGTLTKFLAKSAKKIIAFEIDKSLRPVLEKILIEEKNVEIIFEDFLNFDSGKLQDIIGEKFKAVANLPYYITTPIILKLLEECNLCANITIMVQSEVADRLSAKPGSKDYSAITAAVNLIGSAKIQRKIPRTVFMPPPNVDSAIIRIDIDENKRTLFENKTLRKLVRAAFAMRRKTLANNLIAAFSLSKPQIENIFKECNLSLTVRGESLSAEQFIKLAQAIDGNRAKSENNK